MAKYPRWGVLQKAVLLIVICCFGVIFGFSKNRGLGIAYQEITATPSNPRLVALLNELISDSDCVYPCWWVWTLGKDTSVQVRQAGRLDLDVNLNESDIGDFHVFSALLPTAANDPDDAYFLKASLTLWVNKEENKLVAAGLAFDKPTRSYVDWTPYMPAGILATYGEPDEVRVSYPLDGAPGAGYYLDIAYFDKGLFVSYLMVYVTLGGVTDDSLGIPICNYLADISTFKMWIQTEELDAEDIGMFWDGLRSKQPYEYLIEDISSYDMEPFTEAFSEPDTCIYTLPYDEWVRSE
ncbi:MAG: hypothetical protein DPW16_00735 [Chloroflexi bacterium]|nr:hypothetical protein [Chloroflexota bacterium]